MAIHPLQQVSHQAQHTLLIATADQDQRAHAFLAAQLDADGHTVYEADTTTEAVAKLSAHAIDMLILGRLERPADARALLRAVRSGEHPRIHPAQPVITLGGDDELTVPRAYECGSDHHLADSTGYLLLRAVLASVARRALEEVSSRHVHVGEIHVDLAARSVDVAGSIVHLSRLEFELLVKFAAVPSGCSASTSFTAASGAASRSAGGPSKATSRGCAAAWPTPAPARCWSTSGARAGR